MENYLHDNINSSEGLSEALSLLQKKEAEINQLQADNLYLKHELDKLKRMLFGAKSERFLSDIHPDQLSLKLGVEPQSVPEPVKETIAYQRNKPLESSRPPIRGDCCQHT